MTGVERGDAGRKLIERATVRIGKPRERAAYGLGFGRIHDNAGAACVGIDFEHIKGSLCAGDRGANPARIGAAGEPRLSDAFARGLIEKLDATIDRLGSALGL